MTDTVPVTTEKERNYNSSIRQPSFLDKLDKIVDTLATRLRSGIKGAPEDSVAAQPTVSGVAQAMSENTPPRSEGANRWKTSILKNGTLAGGDLAADAKQYIVTSEKFDNAMGAIGGASAPIASELAEIETANNPTRPPATPGNSKPFSRHVEWERLTSDGKVVPLPNTYKRFIGGSNFELPLTEEQKQANAKTEKWKKAVNSNTGFASDTKPSDGTQSDASADKPLYFYYSSNTAEFAVPQTPNTSSPEAGQGRGK